MRRRLLGALAALLLTLLGTGLLVTYVRGAEDRALAGERTVDVLVVAQPVKQGTAAAALDGKVRMEQVPAKVAATSAVSELSSLAGLVTSTDLVPGEQLVRERFVQPEAVGRSGIDTSNLVKMTAELDAERVLGGSLRAGDVVAVIASIDDPALSRTFLHQVPVVGVQGSATNPTGKPGGKEGEQLASAAVGTGGKVMVTLALTEPQAEQLVWSLEHGKVWLALEPTKADQAGTGLVSQGTVLR